MTIGATPGDRKLALAPLDENIDHVRGARAGHLIIEYGDYECPYSRRAFHAIEQVERQLAGNMRFAFRHFPLTGIHPHALAAAAADGDQKPRRSLTMIAVTRPGASALLMMRMLLTPLGTP